MMMRLETKSTCFSLPGGLFGVLARRLSSLFCCLTLTLAAAGCADNTPPEFVEVTAAANTSSHMGPYEVLATVVDDTRVDRVSLFYDINDGQVFEQPMKRLSGDVWRATIAGQPSGSLVRYVLLAIDEDGDQSRFPPADATPDQQHLQILPQ